MAILAYSDWCQDDGQAQCRADGQATPIKVVNSALEGKEEELEDRHQEAEAQEEERLKDVPESIWPTLVSRADVSDAGRSDITLLNVGLRLTSTETAWSQETEDRGQLLPETWKKRTRT